MTMIKQMQSDDWTENSKNGEIKTRDKRKEKMKNKGSEKSSRSPSTAGSHGLSRPRKGSLETKNQYKYQSRPARVL